MCFVIVYPIGIPLFYFIKLKRYHQQGILHDAETRAQMGFLYEAYTDQCWYWELVDMVFKLVMTSLVQLLPWRWHLQVHVYVRTS